jgi:hypothetical protein
LFSSQTLQLPLDLSIRLYLFYSLGKVKFLGKELVTSPAVILILVPSSSLLVLKQNFIDEEDSSNLRP